jgi:hypothetical protein
MRFHGRSAPCARYSLVHRVIAVAVVILACQGCLGPTAIRGTRLHYNQAYERTADQEILLNIVRLRYADSPVFIDLPAITSQFEAASNGAGGSTSTPGLGQIAGNFAMRDAPTLSYAPRTGREYAKSLITPLQAESLFNTSPGGNTRNVFLAAVDSINGVRNAPLATSPYGCVREDNQAYRYAVDAIIALQARGAIELRIATERDFAAGIVPTSAITPQVLMDTLEKDFVLRQDEASVRIAKPRKVLAVVIRPEEYDSPEMRDLCEIFHLTPGRRMYRVVSHEADPVAMDSQSDSGLPGDASAVELLPAPEPDIPPAESLAVPGRSSQRGDTISLNMRSIYQVMTFLSKGVEVPDSHIDRGIVQVCCAADGRRDDWTRLTKGLFRVHVQRFRPWHAEVAVPYRDHWFYIAESDVQTRAVLSHVLLAIEHQVADAKTAAPVLTLPLR